MTLPSSPFVCEGIDLEAAAKAFDSEDLVNGATGTWKREWTEPTLLRIIAAALGETIPAEVEDRWFDVDAVALGYPDPEALIKTRKERYVTTWQPVTGDSV